MCGSGNQRSLEKFIRRYDSGIPIDPFIEFLCEKQYEKFQDWSVENFKVETYDYMESNISAGQLTRMFRAEFKRRGLE